MPPVQLPAKLFMLTLAAALSFSCDAQPGIQQGHGEQFNPSGLYFHAWTGASAGTEWALVHEEPDGVYRLTDWIGNGFRFRMTGDRNFEVINDGQGGSGGGTFSNAGEASFDWKNWGMSFHSRIWRMPGTDASMRDVTGKTVASEYDVSGVWNVILEEISPATGDVVSREQTIARLRPQETSLSFDWKDGSFDQAVFIEPRLAVFQVWAKGPKSGRYATPDGCATSRDVDTFGQAIAESADKIVINLATQTRDKVGLQSQRQFRYVLTR